MPMYEYRAKALRVVDGDTLYLAVDMGLETTRILEVRLYGINCPELHGESRVQGGQAKAYTSDWVANHATAEGWLLLHTIKDKKEKYGRYLALIFDGDGEELCLNDQLVEDGHAVYKDY